MSGEPLRAWRIVKKEFLQNIPGQKVLSAERIPWNGFGAQKFPQRWNIAGNPVVYASESRALAAWEVFIHSSVPELIAPGKHCLVSATIHSDFEDLCPTFAPRELPANWDAAFVPSSSPNPSQVFGHKNLIEQNKLALRIPSVVIAGEFNYVINVNHPAFDKLTFSKLELFDFDHRLRHHFGDAASSRI